MKFVLIGLTITLSTKVYAARNCKPTEVHWMKCTGKLPKGIDKNNVKISANPAKAEACYTWLGQAEFNCRDGRWVPIKSSQSCKWDCLCCY